MDYYKVVEDSFDFVWLLLKISDCTGCFESWVFIYIEGNKNSSLLYVKRGNVLCFW